MSFVDFFFPLVSFFVALHGPLSSLFQPLGVPSRTPFPTFGRPLSSLLQLLSGPSPFFVALRGYLFAFSWKSFLPLATFGGSLLSFLQPLSGPSRTPARPLAEPSRASSNPLVALRRSSWPFVDIFLPSWSFVALRGYLCFPMLNPSFKSLSTLHSPLPLIIHHSSLPFPSAAERCGRGRRDFQPGRIARWPDDV